MDKIHIKDLVTQCIIGVNEEERHTKQDVVINITLHADLSQAGRTDNFRDTVDYKAVKQRVLAMAQESEYFLIEALAEKIAEICLDFVMVQMVDVLVEKPGALRFTRTVGVEITRSKFV